MNTVRKHVSEIKGGQLARAFFPAFLHALILSDVPGDDVSVIASGPVSADETSFKDAWNVIDKYFLRDKIPASILNHLDKGIKGSIPDTPVCR